MLQFCDFLKLRIEILNKKREKLLDEMIAIYIRDGKPLGSESLRLELQYTNFSISSATIRNYFKALGNEGILSQPHISSGRIPTNSALRNYWRKNIDISNSLEISSLKDIASASEKYGIFCGIRFYQNEILDEVLNFRDKYIILLFKESNADSTLNAESKAESCEAILPHSEHLYHFLQEMLYHNIEEIRFVARSVCANLLFYKLDFHNEIFNFGCKFLEISDSDLFMEILKSHIFYRLKNGFHFIKEGYLGLIQDISFDKKDGKMFIFGKLGCNYASFYNEIAS